MTCPQGTNQPTETVLITLVQSQVPRGCAQSTCCATIQMQTAAQQSTLSMAEVHGRSGGLAAVFLGHHTGSSVPEQAHHANPQPQPSPAPPSMEKARAPGSHSQSGNERSA